MKIEESFFVDAPPIGVWTVITDPVRMMPCIPGCELIEVISPTLYKARVVVKMGPITARFALDVQITEQVYPDFILSLTRGEEGSRASMVSASNVLKLTPAGSGRTEVYYSSEISVTGRLAKFGLGIMKKKAKAMGEDFAVTFRDLVEKGELAMRDMTFHQPRTLDAALKLLASHEDARPLAGGATLVAMMNAGLAEPPVLVSLRNIRELKAVSSLPDGGFRLGAMRKHREVASDKRLKGGQELLREAAALIAVPPVRNMGTLGGATAFADPAADYPPSLVALGATLELASAQGRRIVKAADFFVDWYVSALEPGEMITAITLPVQPKGSVGVYDKLAKVTGDLAIVSIALVLAMENGVCSHLSIALGGCGPIPVVAPDEQAAQIGKPVNAEAIERLGQALAKAADPVDDVRASSEYRRLVIPRMLAKAFARAISPRKERRS